MEKKKLIDLYVKYLDEKDKYERDFKEPFSNLELALNAYLEILSVKDLTTLCFEYATKDNFQKKVNIFDLFKIILNTLFSKLSALSLMDLIDLIAYMGDCLRITKIPYYHNKNLLDKRKDKKEYADELKICLEDVTIYDEKILMVLENLFVDKVILYIDDVINKTPLEELMVVLETIKERSAKNSERIIALAKDKKSKSLQVGCNINDYSSHDAKINDIYDSIESLEDMNKTYENYHESLSKKVKNSSNSLK